LRTQTTRNIAAHSFQFDRVTSADIGNRHIEKIYHHAVMPEQLSNTARVVIMSRRLLGHTICLLLLACLFFTPQIIRALIFENLGTWSKVVIISTLITATWMYLPALSPRGTIFMVVDCNFCLNLINLFVVYWAFWYSVWTGETSSEPLPQSVLGVPIGDYIAILTSYTVSLAIWRSRQMQSSAHSQNRQFNFEEARFLRQQAANASAITTAAFSKWREDCRTLLQTPELIIEMPRLLYVPCVNSTCDTISSHLQICTHGLRKLYEDARLDWWELATELSLWNPDGMKVNQMGEDCKIEFLSMADEITHVLQEIRPFSRAYHARETTMGA
jgi:hypothetical protein